MAVGLVFVQGRGYPGATPERALEVREDRRYTGRVRVVPLRLDEGDIVQATVWESVVMKDAAELSATIWRVLKNQGYPPVDRREWLFNNESILASLQAQTYVRDADVIAIKPWPTGVEPPKPVQRHG